MHKTCGCCFAVEWTTNIHTFIHSDRLKTRKATLSTNEIRVCVMLTNQARGLKNMTKAKYFERSYPQTTRKQSEITLISIRLTNSTRFAFSIIIVFIIKAHTVL